jgi:hypothetical protein
LDAVTDEAWPRADERRCDAADLLVDLGLPKAAKTRIVNPKPGRDEIDVL